MLYFLLFVVISFFLGSYHRDRRMREHISDICLDHIEDDSFLVGDGLNYVRCLNILNEEEIRVILDSI